MISQRVLSCGAAGVAVYFAVLGIQTGLLVLGSISSFLIGGRTGCSGPSLSRTILIFCTIVILHIYSINAGGCSRESSRNARIIINRQVVPRYSLHHVEMPTTCPLSPANDQYAAQEVMKRRLGSDWMCSVCGKSFKSEGELESHLVVNHKVHQAGGCLADLCPILRCEPIFGIPKDHVECDEDQMSKLKLKCMNMIRDLCSPVHLDSVTKLQLEVAAQASICAYLTCEEYWTAPDDDDTGTHYYYTIYTIALCVFLALLVVYFKIASSNIDSNITLEQIMADADKYERAKPAVIPPDMEIRHRTAAIERQWSENE